jgi:hypothetical protein
MKSAFLFCVFLLANVANAADDFRVMKLEQDMRNLERQVQMLQRQLSELQQQSGSAARTYAPRPEREPSTNEDAEKWLSTAAWDRVRAGMSELQVVEILGKPTAVRPDAEERRALLYTLEIGTTGFLTGSISFDAGKVVAIQKPALR